jgi:hypothetical protein
MRIGGGDIDKKTGKTGKLKGNSIGAYGLYWGKGNDGNLI